MALWFGKLADGTEASVTDLIYQDVSVVQATRIRIPRLLSHEETSQALQHTRQRYPELNREENPSLYSPSRLSRVNLPEKVAAQSISFSIAPQSSSINTCRDQMLTLMRENIEENPSTFSRLGWRVDILHAMDGDNAVAWIVVSISHNNVDGVALVVMIDDFLQGYSDLLEGKTLNQRSRLPSYSALPREHAPLKSSHTVGFGLLGWLASLFFGLPGSPAPKLLTAKAAKNAKEAQVTRENNGRSQYEGPMHVDFLEISDEVISDLRVVARSAGLTVGALVQSAFFLAIAKRFFLEHPDKNKLSHTITMSVNMRPYLQPPLPKDVLAPQQGDIGVVMKTTRAEIDDTKVDPSASRSLLFRVARDVMKQLQHALAKPEMFAPLHGDIFLASLFRNGQKKMGKGFQYVGDSWFSNVGAYSPTKLENIRVESTLTLNKTVPPAYELLWCNTVVGGAMTLSMVADETMGRTKESIQNLLQQVERNLASVSQ